MSSETLFNQLQIDQIVGNEAFIRAIQALQADAIKFGNLLQQADGQTAFPRVPENGGLFITDKGIYEGIFTDATPPAEPVPQWRRLTGGNIHAVGSTIPTTL